ncbi:hypothetical protein, partial [Xylanibacter caecicola]|uniref:hypothetical protein n=1 Tax=Xylanibacter caecicola TaxID=2736294 RepID=UPI002582D45B
MPDSYQAVSWGVFLYLPTVLQRIRKCGIKGAGQLSAPDLKLKEFFLIYLHRSFGKKHYLCIRQPAPQQLQTGLIAFGLHCLCIEQAAPQQLQTGLIAFGLH